MVRNSFNVINFILTLFALAVAVYMQAFVKKQHDLIDALNDVPEDFTV
jgi:hypothetical protein